MFDGAKLYHLSNIDFIKPLLLLVFKLNLTVISLLF